jgi:FixJ family two-component response regulator
MTPPVSRTDRLPPLACKAHVPTEVTRALAFGLVVNGVTKKQVARHIGIDVKTLAVHYEAEVEFGLQKAVRASCQRSFEADAETESRHAKL